jgi:restriction system protein
MAKKNTSFFNLLTEAPWWVSVVVAAITYVGLTHILPNIETGNPIVDMIFKSFPYAGPFFAVIFLLATPFAFFNNRRKRKLLDDQQDIDSIKALSWKEFEELVAEAYRRKGFRVIENGFGPDGGVDVKLIKDNQTTLVQCKDHGVRSLIFDVHKISRAVIIIKGITEGENFLEQVKAKHNLVKNKNKQPVVGN